jgi:thioredoxin 1
MSILKEIEDAQFEEAILKGVKPSLVEFTSPECIICKTMKERIGEISGGFKDKVNFFRLDINKSAIWKNYNVRSIPTLLYFKGGVVVARQDLFPEKEEMSAILNSLLKK